MEFNFKSDHCKQDNPAILAIALGAGRRPVYGYIGPHASCRSPKLVPGSHSCTSPKAREEAASTFGDLQGSEGAGQLPLVPFIQARGRGSTAYAQLRWLHLPMGLCRHEGITLPAACMPHIQHHYDVAAILDLPS